MATTAPSPRCASSSSTTASPTSSFSRSIHAARAALRGTGSPTPPRSSRSATRCSTASCPHARPRGQADELHERADRRRGARSRNSCRRMSQAESPVSPGDGDQGSYCATRVRGDSNRNRGEPCPSSIGNDGTSSSRCSMKRLSSRRGARDWLDALRRSAPDVAAELTALLRGHLGRPWGFPRRPSNARSPGSSSAPTRWTDVGHGGMGTVWLAKRSDGRFEGSPR